MDRQTQLEDALARRKAMVLDYLARNQHEYRFVPQDIHDAVYSYIMAGGKVLRPGVLLFACGAVGGEETRALPAAVAIELFHTWTLVHDDIMDRDTTRRGRPTIHEEFRQRALTRDGYTPQEAQHYGLSIALMTAELQHGWQIALLTDLYDLSHLDPTVVFTLIRLLERDVLLALVEGQTLDIQYAKAPVESLTEDMILGMLWRKTGALYRFAGMAGAMIGLNTADADHPLVEALSTFTSQCGTAFQLQDDILGIIGDEKTLGKPVGSDIREGKRTTILSYTFQRASPAQRRRLLDVVGRKTATDADVLEMAALLQDLGGVDHTKALAQRYVETAVGHLERLPASPHKDLLTAWAEYLIGRTF